MIKIILLIFSHFFRYITRYFYGLFRLSKAYIGSNCSITFPVVIEGSGEIFIGDNCVLAKKTNLGASQNSKIKLRNHVHIGKGTCIKTGLETSILIQDNSKIENSTRLYVNGNWKIGKNCGIATNCAIFAREPGMQADLLIGSGCHIGDFTIIDVCDDITLEDNVALGPNCILYTHDHDYQNAADTAWMGPLKKAPILIKKGAWVGAGVTILPGVTIGQGAVIATGAVVTKDIPENCVFGGIPAKFLKKRK
jgi:acetyltransferase-like isoleucine patch superfamily enzyme